MARIALAHSFDIFGAALLGDLQAVAQRGGEHGEAIGHNLTENASTLTAACYQYAQQAVLAKRRKRRIAQRKHFGPDRIANQVYLASMLGFKSLKY